MRRNDLDWLLTGFVNRVAGIDHALLVSSEGLLLASTPEVSPALGDQLAAVTSGVISLSRGAANFLRAGQLNHTLLEMEGALVLLMSISNGSFLTIVASPTADLGLVGFEMARLTEQLNHTFTPVDRVPQLNMGRHQKIR